MGGAEAMTNDRSSRKKFLVFLCAVSAVLVVVVVITFTVTVYVWRDGGSSSSAKRITTKSEKIKAINKAAATALACEPDFSGLTIGIVQDGETLLASGYGYLSPSAQYRQGVNADTLFGVASITKSFTAALALQMLEDANLDRYANVAGLIGKDFRFYDDKLTKQITVSDLLSHRTGIPGYNFVRFQKNYNRKSILRDMAYLKNTATFRGSYLYSNLAYGLVAHITELLDKKNRTWEDIMSEEIFTPLGMRRTFLRGLNVSRTNVAVPHYTTSSGKFGPVSPDFLRHWGSIGASGSVMTSASDMTHWMRLLLHKGLSKTGARIFSKDVVDTMFQPVIVYEDQAGYPIRPDAPETFIRHSYASGLRNGLYRGYKTVDHTGGTYGYDSIMLLMPSKNIGVFIAFNGKDWDKRVRTSLSLHTLDILLGIDPWLNDKTLCSFPLPWAKPRPSPRDTLRSSTEPSDNAQPGKPKDVSTTSDVSPQLARYTGKYSAPGFGEVLVSLHTNSNRLKLEYGIFRAMLVPDKADNFTMYGEGDTWFMSDSAVAFRGDGGQIKSVQVYGFRQYPVFPKK